MKRSNQGTRKNIRTNMKKLEEQYGPACSIQQLRDAYPPCMKQKALEGSNTYKQFTNRCTRTKHNYNHVKNHCNKARTAWERNYGKEYAPAEKQCTQKMMNVMNAMLYGNKKTLKPCTLNQLIKYSRTMKKQNGR
jgi:hypothetical protein